MWARPAAASTPSPAQPKLAAAAVLYGDLSFEKRVSR